MSEKFICEECCRPIGNTCTCTLQEVANNYAKSKSSVDVFRKAHKQDFLAGAQYQLAVYKDYINLLKEELAYEKRNKIKKEI